MVSVSAQFISSVVGFRCGGGCGFRLLALHSRTVLWHLGEYDI